MSRLAKLLIAAAACCAIFVPGTAGAATVVNGDFETGNLSGWTADYQTGNARWLAYSKSEVSNPLYLPPSGNFALTGEEDGGPDSLVLYQDVALEPYFSHKLSAILYYESEAPIFVPNPNTLFVSEGGGDFQNQQYRVDVIKPTAPIRTTNPSDILATAFANRTDDPTVQGQIPITADLTPLAGQTVRLRIVNVANDYYFYPGLDAVSIASTPPSNVFVKGALTKNRKKGTASLQITVPAPGTVTAAVAKKIKPTTVTATAAGLVTVPLKAIGKGLKTLKKKGKLTVQVPVTYTPSGGTAATQSFKVTLNKKKKPKPKKAG